MEYLLQPMVGSGQPASAAPEKATKKRQRSDTEPAQRTAAVSGGGPRSASGGAGPANKKQKKEKKANQTNKKQQRKQSGAAKEASFGPKPQKAGTGLELLEPELLGPEEQATFFQAQYREHDPVHKFQIGDQSSLPKGAHFKVSSIQSEGKRELTEMSGWLKDICGERWQELLLPSQQKKKGKKNKNKNNDDKEASTSADDDKGAPSVIIITTSGTRACEIYRALNEFNTKTVRVAKLFAKHIKLEEQIALLNAHPVRIAVGTPHRLSELCKNGALKLHRCELIVLDMSKNVKGISLLVRGGEIQTDFYKFYFEHLSERIQNEQMRLSLF